MVWRRANSLRAPTSIASVASGDETYKWAFHQGAPLWLYLSLVDAALAGAALRVVAGAALVRATDAALARARPPERLAAVLVVLRAAGFFAVLFALDGFAAFFVFAIGFCLHGNARIE